MEIFETPLPGVGMRYEFTAEAGDHVGVVVRRDGKRDIALYDREDPTRVAAPSSSARATPASSRSCSAAPPSPRGSRSSSTPSKVSRSSG